jgi:hypothetical protein
MFFPKVDVKNDPVRRWHRPDRHFFANGACQVLAFAFLERYPDLGFHARWIKPAAGFTGNHTYVTDGTNLAPSITTASPRSNDCSRSASSAVVDFFLAGKQR